MLKAAFVLVAISAAFFASAQTKSFVEVVVEDTIQFDAEEIIYLVGHVDWTTTVDSAVADTMAVAVVPDGMIVNRLQEIRQIIQAMQLDTLKEISYSVSPYGGFQESTISIRFLSVEKLRDFTNRIRKLENIKGIITSTKSSREKAVEKILFQRLFNQAKAKAEALAQIAGKKLEAAVSVKEKEQHSGWTMYPPLSALGDRHSETSTEQNGKITLYRGLIIQFNWQ